MIKLFYIDNNEKKNQKNKNYSLFKILQFFLIIIVCEPKCLTCKEDLFDFCLICSDSANNKSNPPFCENC
jgi:hypothetical protein